MRGGGTQGGPPSLLLGNICLAARRRKVGAVDRRLSGMRTVIGLGASQPVGIAYSAWFADKPSAPFEGWGMLHPAHQSAVERGFQ